MFRTFGKKSAKKYFCHLLIFNFEMTCLIRIFQNSLQKAGVFFFDFRKFFVKIEQKWLNKNRVIVIWKQGYKIFNATVFCLENCDGIQISSHNRPSSPLDSAATKIQAVFKGHLVVKYYPFLAETSIFRSDHIQKNMD